MLGPWDGNWTMLWDRARWGVKGELLVGNGGQCAAAKYRGALRAKYDPKSVKPGRCLMDRGKKPLGKFFQVGAAMIGLRALGWAAAGKAEPMVFVADSRRYSGWEAWFANLYNESHLLFTLLTIAVIPITALVLGTIVGRVLTYLGVDLRSRSVGEH